MKELSVRLSAFEGPLDLLLRLIEREEIDIYNIPIHRITQQYLQAIEQDRLDAERGADFLLLATELLEIKSRMLLPDHQMHPVYPDGEDSRAELMERLLAYRRVKATRQMLSKRHEAHRIFSEDFLLDIPSEALKGNRRMEPWVLADAYARAMFSVERFRSEPLEPFERFTKQAYSVSLKQREILQLLSYMPMVAFSTLLSETAAKGEWVASFLALLKLQQDQHIFLKQFKRFSEITIEKRPR